MKNCSTGSYAAPIPPKPHRRGKIKSLPLSKSTLLQASFTGYTTFHSRHAAPLSEVDPLTSQPGAQTTWHTAETKGQEPSVTGADFICGPKMPATFPEGGCLAPYQTRDSPKQIVTDLQMLTLLLLKILCAPPATRHKARESSAGLLSQGGGAARISWSTNKG